jgi:glycosyl transferase family 1
MSSTEAVAKPVRGMKILYLHSNTADLSKRFHERRIHLYTRLGYDVRLFDSTRHFAPTIFPYLDRRWKRRDRGLMKFYETLATDLDWCELFVHYNGANIHPAYLEQFRCFKVYHCADDPDASNVLSRPVAREYDACAVSNIACLDMYRAWGCERVFFWPLGSLFAEDTIRAAVAQTPARDVPLVFVGSKYGASSVRYLGRLLGLYKRRRFMEAVERAVPNMVGYGQNWARGYLADNQLPSLYARSRVGLNKHNSLGPVNHRLFDLAAFGVMQICDNRQWLDRVFRLNEEVIGYESLEECLEAIRHYTIRPDEARAIAAAARRRFERDYAEVPLWETFVKNVEACMRPDTRI